MTWDRPVGRSCICGGGCRAVLDGGGPGLGAQAGEARLRAILREAGFSGFRRVSETPFNIVYEARIEARA